MFVAPEKNTVSASRYSEPNAVRNVRKRNIEVPHLHLDRRPAEIKTTLCDFYARPERREEFRKAFVAGLELGRAIDRLRPVFDHFGVADEERDRLRKLQKLRNTVAHSAPEPGYYEDPNDDTTGIVVSEPKEGGLVLIADMDENTVEALRLSILVRTLRKPRSG